MKSLPFHPFSVVFLCLFSMGLYAQNDPQVEARAYAENIFSGRQLINSQTTTTLQPRSWSFGIQHRFGKVGLDSSLTQQFLGLDLPSIIRFSFSWALSDRFYVEIGRNNFQKTIDVEGKYLFLKQSSDFKVPVSCAAYFNAAIRTGPFPRVPANAYFADDTTVFVYKPSHRLAYNTQLIVSSKLTDRISVQFNPILIYQNLAPLHHDNFTFVLSLGGRYKTGLSSAIIAEYAHVFNNRGDKFYNPFSLGVEFGTLGHTFQVFISNATKILESQLYTSSAVHLANGEFLLGFNLKRTFWRKH